jgi:hypothetical protein
MAPNRAPDPQPTLRGTGVEINSLASIRVFSPALLDRAGGFRSQDRFVTGATKTLRISCDRQPLNLYPVSHRLPPACGRARRGGGGLRMAPVRKDDLLPCRLSRSTDLR